MGQSKSTSKVHLVSESGITENLGHGKITPELMVAHYTPPFFPLVPIVNRATMSLCLTSWKQIIADIPNPDGGPPLSGITAFYTDFYDMLEKFDAAGRFEAILSMHSTGVNKIAAKGAILMRIMNFVLKLDVDHPQELQYSLYMLGKSHNHKGIRPWQYSIFVQAMINTISRRLDSKATDDVMTAWVNLFAFVMRTMLPPAIKGQVVETEVNANATANFVDEETTKKLVYAEEGKGLAKALGKIGGSQAPSNLNSTRINKSTRNLDNPVNF